RMLDLGLKATVNSDDPSYFGGYIGENFQAVAQALELDRGHILTLLKNAIDASFLEAGDKLRLQRQLDEYAGS
ncbi:MAG: adenosine deaminase, partial [Gammaproteobacteria bacterium HGW-Gammaproteobacteria-7]